MSEGLRRLVRLQRVLAAVKASEMVRVRQARAAAERARGRAANLRSAMLVSSTGQAAPELIAEANWRRALHGRANRAEAEAGDHDVAVAARIGDLARAHGRALAFDAVVEQTRADLARDAVRRAEGQSRSKPRERS